MSDSASSPRARLPFLIRVPLLLLLAVASVSAAVIGATLIFYTATLPDPMSLRPRTSGAVIRILARDGTVLDERGASRDYLPLDFIPPHVTDAVLAVEDRRFHYHLGIDPLGLLRAAIANYRAGRTVEGGSTLTQQLAKNLFLSPERTLARKLEELTLALWLELRLSKRDILELYLNRVYFGGGAHGVEAAAQRHFDKAARDLTLAEAAVIAGLLKAPSKYAPSARPEQAIARGRLVLASMRDAGFITGEQERAAGIDALRFGSGGSRDGRHGAAYAVDFVMDALPPFKTPDGADIVVDTTLDAALQRHAATTLGRLVDRSAARLAVSQGAAIVLDPSGAVRAIVGGRSYAESQFNRVTRARRQPGSAFKPFVYLAALEAGRTPDDLVPDRPITVAGWSPKNDGDTYAGEVALRSAIARSLNTVAVRLLLDVGPRTVAETARRLGIESALRAEASLALGTSEVSLYELAAAYAPFANGGFAAEPYVVTRIRTTNGDTLFARTAPTPTRVVRVTEVAAMTDMLAGAVTGGTGRRARLDGRSVAGKTGTSQGFRDAWFVGFTSELVAGVWVGNDDGRPMSGVVGGSLPAEIWREIMLAAHAPAGPRDPGLGPRIASPASNDPLAALLAGDGPTADPIAHVLAGGTLEHRDRQSLAVDGEGATPSIVVRPPGHLAR